MNRPDALADLPAPWGGYDLTSGPAQRVRFGPRDLWMRQRDGEIWLALTTSTGLPRDPTPEEGASSPELSWSRWATPGGETSLVLRPSLPDRVIVLEPERPFRLLPGAEARVYVRVPLFIRVELPVGAPGDVPLVLDELPSLPLSDTWWGDFMEGELAYWLNTTARREMRDDLFAPHLAVCPIQMRNRALEDLRVEKLALRVSHLGLFLSGERLWTDESQVVYLSEGEGTQVEAGGKAPQEAPDGVLVTPPRAGAPRGMRERTFGLLAELSGLGGAD